MFSIVYTVRGGGSTTLCFISDRVCFGGSTFGWWQCCSGKGIIIISSIISFIPISNIISIPIITIHHHQGGASLGSGSSPITSQGGGGGFILERVVSNCISTSCILSKNFITVVLVSIDVDDGGHNVDSGFKTPLLSSVVTIKQQLATSCNQADP